MDLKQLISRLQPTWRITLTALIDMQFGNRSRRFLQCFNSLQLVNAHFVLCYFVLAILYYIYFLGMHIFLSSFFTDNNVTVLFIFVFNSVHVFILTIKAKCFFLKSWWCKQILSFSNALVLLVATQIMLYVVRSYDAYSPGAAARASRPPGLLRDV